MWLKRKTANEILSWLRTYIRMYVTLMYSGDVFVHEKCEYPYTVEPDTLGQLYLFFVKRLYSFGGAKCTYVCIRTVRRDLKICRTMRRDLKLCRTVRRDLKMCRTMGRDLKMCRTMGRDLKMCRTMGRDLKMCRTMGRDLKMSPW